MAEDNNENKKVSFATNPGAMGGANMDFTSLINSLKLSGADVSYQVDNKPSFKAKVDAVFDNIARCPGREVKQSNYLESAKAQVGIPGALGTIDFEVGATQKLASGGGYDLALLTEPFFIESSSDVIEDMAINSSIDDPSIKAIPLEHRAVLNKDDFKSIYSIGHMLAYANNIDTSDGSCMIGTTRNINGFARFTTTVWKYCENEGVKGYFVYGVWHNCHVHDPERHGLLN